MKRMNLTEILSRVALEQTDEQRQLLEQFAEGKKTVSPPVTIRLSALVWRGLNKWRTIKIIESICTH
ncbi:hypothetical protein A8L51_20375 [Pantoea stewartii]|nr:hypothetical protein [Pantoea stewartii]